MILGELSRNDVERVRQWRNQTLKSLRTPYLLTKEMQGKFYDEVICNPQSPHRYWVIRRDGTTLGGMGGITNIQWENRLGEISLIVNPTLRGKRIGTEAVERLLDKAFNELNLQTVFGECYLCGPYGFWQKIAEQYGGATTLLPSRKYWNGEYWNSLYFSIDKDGFNAKSRRS